MITGVAWWYSARSKTITTMPVKSAKAGVRGSTKALRAACQNGDPESASKAIIVWAKAHWPEHPPLSNGEITARVSDTSLIKALHELDRTLYAPQPSPWLGSELMKAIECFEKHRTIIKGRSVIPPLNPAIK